MVSSLLSEASRGLRMLASSFPLLWILNEWARSEWAQDAGMVFSLPVD